MESCKASVFMSIMIYILHVYMLYITVKGVVYEGKFIIYKRGGAYSKGVN